MVCSDIPAKRIMRARSYVALRCVLHTRYVTLTSASQHLCLVLNNLNSYLLSSIPWNMSLISPVPAEISKTHSIVLLEDLCQTGQKKETIIYCLWSNVNLSKQTKPHALNPHVRKTKIYPLHLL